MRKGRILHAGGRASGGLSHGRTKAFTLVELLVIMVLIALLAAILLPYLAQTVELAYRTMCQRNLRCLADALHTSEGEDATLPSPSGWVKVAAGRASKEILFCKADKREKPEVSTTGIEELYILQYHTNSKTNWDASFLTSILDGGGPAVNDPQIWAWYPAGGVHDTPKGEEWPPSYLPDLADNQAFIGVDNDSAIRITFGADILIECWEPPHKQYSRHWLMTGKGTPVHPLPDGASPDDEDDAELLRMWSRDFQQIDPRSPLRIGGAVHASYGMNGRIKPRKWGPQQFMLMDANNTYLDVDGEGNLETIWEGESGVAPRHYIGRRREVNVVCCDSSVRAMTLLELKREFDAITPRNRWNRR